MNVKLSGIELTYSYKKVLRGVDVDFMENKIHALLGENGAGKSSLMKILTGFTRPTAGRLFLDETEMFFKRPADSLSHGIACVYQRPYLSDSLSVLDNLRVGVKNRVTEKDLALLPEIDFLKDISLNKKVQDLSGNIRFFVAFCGALLRNPKVLILDEPTALLDSEESEKLFKALRARSENGMNIIVITHKMEDLKFCDDVTYLVEGKIQKTFSREEVERGDFVPAAERETEFREMNGDLDSAASFEIRKKSGLKAGIIPSDRTYLASNPNLTITQLVCSTFNESRNPKIRKAHTEEIIRRAEINIRPEEKVYNLSGGMLQRLILERELYSNPDTIYLEDPFQGLDPVSVNRLSARLEECRKKGSEIILVSGGSK